MLEYYGYEAIVRQAKFGPCGKNRAKPFHPTCHMKPEPLIVLPKRCMEVWTTVSDCPRKGRVGEVWVMRWGGSSPSRKKNQPKPWTSWRISVIFMGFWVVLMLGRATFSPQPTPHPMCRGIWDPVHQGSSNIRTGLPEGVGWESVGGQFGIGWGLLGG